MTPLGWGLCNTIHILYGYTDERFINRKGFMNNIEFQGAMQKVMDEILKFSEKVAPVYEILNWTWGDPGIIPSVEEIAETLAGLLSYFTPEMIEKREILSSGTGGLVVGWDYEVGGFCLSMCIEPEKDLHLQQGVYVYSIPTQTEGLANQKGYL